MSDPVNPAASARKGDILEDPALMAEMLEVAPVGVMIHDFDGNFFYANQRAKEIHGYDLEEFVKLGLEGISTEDSRALIEERYRLLREHGEAKFEVAHIRKDGSIVPLEVFARAVKWKGEPAIFSLTTDITARRATEAALDEERRQLLSIFDSLDQTIYVSDPQTHEIIYANKHLCSFLGANPVGGKCYVEFQSFDAPCEFCTNRIILENGGRPHYWEHYNETVGRHYWVVDRIIRWPDGRDVRFEMAFDISDRKEAEEQRDRLEKQLALAQRMESIGLLAGGVAHDFNNLLTVINNFCALVLKELPQAHPSRSDLLQVLGAGDRAAALTRQLLAFSRKQVLQPVALDLNSVVGGVEGMLRRLLGEDIEIEVHLTSPLGRVMADPGQMEQVLINLAINARDAMRAGGKLTIETSNVELDEEYSRQHIAVAPGDYVRLSITDTGEGMAPEIQGRIFEPFFSTKERGRGTGLGLATVYGIVKQSCGSIWVYSEPGAGATFKVYLPSVDAPAVDLRRRPCPMETTGDETILLVEDEETVRIIAERILKLAGYKVYAAEGGQEALSICEKLGGKVDLLLTDVIMPKISGRQLAEKIGGLYPKVKVLFMSGYTDNAIVHHGVLAEGTHFIAKPFSANELARKVREALEDVSSSSGGD